MPTSSASSNPNGPLSIGLLAAPWVPIPPPAYGGSELVIDTLARGLERAGHEVHLFTTGDSDCPVDRAELFEHADPDRMGTTVLELRHVAAAYEFFADLEVDLVHDHTLAGLFYCGRPDDIPIVTTCHGPFNDDLGDLYHRVSPSVHVIAISNDQASRAPSDVRVAAVIHHGIDTDRYSFSATPDDQCLFLGRLDPTKGVSTAIRAARRAGYPLVIAAKMRNPIEVRYFETEIKPLLGPDVTFIGEADTSTKVDLLRRSKALINPIRWPEPFGLVMIEAMACGTPVIGYPGGAAPEIVDDGTTGFLVDNEDALVAAIGRVDGLDRLACRQAVEQRFSADRMVADHVRLYRQVLAGRTPDVRRVVDLRNLEGDPGREPGTLETPVDDVDGDPRAADRDPLDMEPAES